MNYQRSNSIVFAAFLILAFASAAQADSTHPGTSSDPTLIPGISYSATTDSMPVARVIVYRPDNQLSRPYKMNSNLGETFKIRRNGVIKLETSSGVFQGKVGAFGHNRGYFSHELSPNKVHYFRLQDRNNYQGFLPFLEVIEVSETTFRNEILDGLTR
ncbi:MAG: hypothetical protein IT261_00925 [Saprospiraceae bacterium]|nr:hypothetical protein [Saprospiraceae bacterium]